MKDNRDLVRFAEFRPVLQIANLATGNSLKTALRNRARPFSAGQ
jgi:hypothetical protein